MIKTLKHLFVIISCSAYVSAQAQVNIINTIAGNDTTGFRGDNGLAINAEFNTPESLCLDKYGNIYIADVYNNRIRKITTSTGIITTIAGTNAGGYNGDNIPATNALLSSPESIAVDTAGNIYIGDGQNYRVRKVNSTSGVITTVVGSGVSGNIGDGIPATNAQIKNVSGLCFDKFGNLYIVDWLNSIVRKVDAITGIISTFVGTTAGYSGDNGPATNAQIQATSVFADSLNNIYLADEYNYAIRKVDALTGIITTIAGKDTAGYSGDNGQATNAKLNKPRSLYIDRQQNIFIADYQNAAIRRIDALTGIITTVAGNGILGYSGDDGPATNAELKCSGVFLDDTGTIYIADWTNNAIRKVYTCSGPPVASFTATGTNTVTYTYSGTTFDIDSVQWSFGDGSISTVMNPVHTYTVSGHYEVCVKVYSYCGVDSVCKVDTITLGIASPWPSTKERVVLWPNPVSNELMISNAAGSVLFVYNVVGEEVYRADINMEKEGIHIDFLPKGLYIVQLIDRSTGELTVRKIIKDQTPGS